MVMFALVVGIAFGASVLGGKSKDGSAPRTPRVETGAGTPNSKSETPIKPDPPVTAVVPSAVPDAGVAQEHAPIADTPKPTKLKHSITTPIISEGSLVLDSKPETDVLIDGDHKGHTPLVGVKLSVGNHKITLTNATYSIKESFRIEIKQGQLEKVIKDYSDRIPTPKSSDLNGTINPFKKGSASR